MRKLRREKQKQNSFVIIRNSLLRITVLLIIIGLNWAGLSAVIETVAYYNDTEDSDVNTYQAGILDFYLSSPTSNFIPLETVTNMKAGDSVTREISVIKETNSNLFKYNAQTVQTGGNIDFCNILTLEAKLDGETKYSDGLIAFNITPPIVIGDDGKDDWLFTVTLPIGATFTPGEVCQIKFVFNGWQINLSDSSVGFSDQEEISSSFAAGGIKINKVYYDVDAQHGIEGDNEWIEIYNPLNNPVDISGWIIEDNDAIDTIPVSPPIPAKGFAVITGNSSTWEYWNIPAGVVKIVLTDGKIGSGLDDDSDRVILKMPSGTEDDAMSYGADTYAFDPACSDVAEGHILARVPSGFDTNQASDWKDLELPQVTVVLPNGGEVVWVGHYYDLKWTATNQNGDNELLSIDIWYSRDSGATWANIVKGTENDGLYNWRIPLSINGYYVPSEHARIKVVATGPENFMVQNQDMSDEDFCPPIDFSLLTPEEMEMAIELGLIIGQGEDFNSTVDENPISEEPVAGSGEDNTAMDTETEEAPNTEEPAAEEAISEETPVEENVTEEPIVEENPIPTENQEEGIIDEILPETELFNEEAEEEPVVEEVQEILEIPEVQETLETPEIKETPVIEEQPASEEQPVTLAEDSSSFQGEADGSDGTEGSGESSEESGGDVGESVSE